MARQEGLELVSLQQLNFQNMIEGDCSLVNSPQMASYFQTYERIKVKNDQNVSTKHVFS